MSKPTSDALPSPPIAPRKPASFELHGHVRADEYHWLENKGEDEVTSYLTAENAYADAVMKPTEKLQGGLYDEILARIQQTDLSVPVKRGSTFYYSRTQEGKQYAIHCRKRGSLDAAEEVILDVNEAATGHSFFALGAFSLSDDGRYLAYSIDTTGFREYRLQVKDLETGALGPESRDKVGTVAWAADGKTMFYSVDDAAKRPHRIYRHELGDDHETDVLVYEENDERFRVAVGRSRSKAYLFVAAASHTASEMRYVAADKPHAELQLIEPRSTDHEYYVDHRGKLFYIRTNDTGRNFRVVTAPVASPAKKNWKPLFAHSEALMIEDFQLFSDHWVMSEREGGLQHLRLGMFGGKNESYRIPMPESVYAVFGAENPEFGTHAFRYTYTSLTTPSSVYDYDIGKRASVLLKETEVLGGYDRTRYQAERIVATANDGEKIPISLVYEKGTPRDGSARMLLTGYGAYGVPYPVTFSHARVSLLDRGFILAFAHVRGGGEMGKKWHDDGRMANKMNTFTDFIAVAEHLVAQKYTSPDRLAIEGGSAGGLLMGAVTNLRPDLFGIVIAHVPFFDVLNTMLDESLPLTVGEFEEWGNPKVEADYRAMQAYCPYTNLEARRYPTMLIKTSYNDSQVMYWEPAKYVARLRTLKTDDNLLLFKINMAGGHGGSSGRYDKLRETAFDYAFLLTYLAK